MNASGISDKQTNHSFLSQVVPSKLVFRFKCVVCVGGGWGLAVWCIAISEQFIWLICATLLKYIPEMFLSRSNWIQFFFRYKSTHLYSCCWKLGLRIEEVHCSGWFLEVICFLVLMLATRMSFYSIMWLYQAWNGKKKNIAVIYSPQCCSKQEFIVNTDCQAPKRCI